jgi:O-antigen ligase
LGLKFLGEPDLSSAIQNVAKIDVAGEKLIRAYGTMPHANVLGGFLFAALVVCLMLVLFFAFIKGKRGDVSPGHLSSARQSGRGTVSLGGKFFQLFHVEQSENNLKMSPKNISLIFILIFCVIYLGFILTFSRSAYLAFVVAPLMFLFSLMFFKRGYLKSVLRRIKRLKFSRIFPFVLVLAFVIISTLVFWPQIITKSIVLDHIEDYSVEGRIFYAKTAFEMIRKNADFGTGPGTFAFEMKEYVEKPHELKWWQYQPVHNVLLLIGSELGIICLLLFTAFISWLIGQAYFALKQKDFREKLFLSTGLVCLFGFLIIMQFDHYLWTLQQGQFVLWFVLGMLVTATTELR